MQGAKEPLPRGFAISRHADTLAHARQGQAGCRGCGVNACMARRGGCGTKEQRPTAFPL